MTGTGGLRTPSARARRLATGAAVATCVVIGLAVPQPAAAATTTDTPTAASGAATAPVAAPGAATAPVAATGAAAAAPLVVTSPGYGTTVDGPTVTVTGLGAPGDRVTFADDRGRAGVFPDATVGADGTWVTSATFVPGDRVFAVGTSAITGATALVSVDVRGTVGSALTVDPTASRGATGDFVLTGTGTPGNLVELDPRSGAFTGSAVVRADGRWSIPIGPGWSSGFHAGEIAERNGATTVATGFYGVYLIG